MLHDIAVLAVIAVASYLVVTFHSAVIAKIKAETSGIASTAQRAEARAKYYEQRVATDIRTGTGEVITDIKADASKVEAKL